ncbi:TPA: hypothetical protein ACS8CE_003474 [Providencia alcalifaciens]
MKLKTVKIGYIVSGVAVALIMTGGYFNNKSRENNYLSAKHLYLNEPSQQHKEAFLALIKEQSESIFSNPFDSDDKEELVLTAIKEKDYSFINFLSSYFTEWYISQVDSASMFIKSNGEINYFEKYHKIGEKLADLDSSKLSRKAYNVKIAYAINTMPIRDFYQKYSEDILNTKEFTLASYIQIVFSYLGCRQETLAWRNYSHSDTPATLNKYELPDINTINQNEFWKQKADLLSGKVPDISSQCLQRLESSGNVILEFSNGKPLN